MPIFVKLTDSDGGSPVWINTSKVVTMYDSLSGGTMLCIDGGANWKVVETPVEILDKTSTAAYQLGIGR
jgi:hypothetical protein